MRTATPTPELELTCTPAPAPAPTHTQTRTRTHPVPIVKELTKSSYTSHIDNNNDVWEEFDCPIINLIPDALEERKVLVVRGKYGLQGFVQLVCHLMYDCHVNSGLLEGKLSRLIEAINVVVAAPPNNAPQTKAKPRSRKAKAVGKFKPWRIPDLICPKWLYCSNWKEKPENKEKTMDKFEDYWAWFEKNEKDELRKYQELSHKKNSETRNNA
ncbi:hypothetical protein Moror_3552 [Moniliophthora roreri MCA 2997]|nr:hypothetical protein Moror_3552 [Moniliophthora roreri MCA 2997]